MTLLKLSAAVLLLFVALDRTLSQCVYPAHQNQTPAADKKIEPLKGHRYTVDDPNGKYQYRIGICTSATAEGDPKSVSGVLQFDKDEDGNVKNTDATEIGQFDKADIIAGTNWVYLEYAKGDEYNTHCGGEPRKAVILITCDPEATDANPGPKLMEENANKSAGCYYLFELPHPEICADYTPSKTMLSVGSIILIVFFCVAAVYLVAGALYQRLVLGAKGMEQIPNYEFWKDFGNLQADGCDFVCRSHDSRRSSPYKGLGDDQLVEDADERDDNLLPM